MFFAALMYHNQIAHWVFALSMLAASAWNGAGFYGKVWATKYTSQVQELAKARVVEESATPQKAKAARQQVKK